MPDPSASAELVEAYALAGSNDLLAHTMELQHRLFVDEAGNPDSIWVVLDEADLVATIESGAPVRAGEAVTFRAYSFKFSLAPIDVAQNLELEVEIDNVDRRIEENLELAAADTAKIVMRYRPYLMSDLSEPQMIPPPAFTLSEVRTDAFKARARARVDIDLRGAFPRRVYTAAEFPGLIGL